MFKKASAQNVDEPVQNASAREFMDIKIKLPDTKGDVHILDNQGNLVKSQDYDPVAQAKKSIAAQKDNSYSLNVPNPNKDFILKQKQAKIDQMRKKMKENKAKMGALNQNIGKLQNDCLILKNMYAMAALDT
jgi:hypothetical protein